MKAFQLISNEVLCKMELVYSLAMSNHWRPYEYKHCIHK